MTKKTTVISHNGAVYDIAMGGWLQHLHSKTSDAILEISTDDIQLPDGKAVGTYKAEKKAEYKSNPQTPRSSAKQYLNDCSRRDFGHDWDKFIGLIKEQINSACVHLLIAPHPLSTPEQQEVLKAASNGHIAAMYWIGTALRNKQSDDCLRWLSMAHNRGHFGACHEMAVHFAASRNYIDSLRCLIISADGGCDIAYMSIFQISTLKNMFNIQEISLVENMLRELEGASHASSANYFKGMLMLFSNQRAEGISVLKRFLKEPKKKPPEYDIDEVYGNQIRLVSTFIESVLLDITTGTALLNSISTRGTQAGFCSFADYDEFVKIINDKHISG
ncbi:hypothetical protein [Pseudomonas poae]|uniref:hypothetical protein n=1 Tax=Pseudomonas poae TaxID=200451 RepID=UPI0030CEE938